MKCYFQATEKQLVESDKKSNRVTQSNFHHSASSLWFSFRAFSFSFSSFSFEFCCCCCCCWFFLLFQPRNVFCMYACICILFDRANELCALVVIAACSMPIAQCSLCIDNSCLFLFLGLFSLDLYIYSYMHKHILRARDELSTTMYSHTRCVAISSYSCPFLTLSRHISSTLSESIYPPYTHFGRIRDCVLIYARRSNRANHRV